MPFMYSLTIFLSAFLLFQVQPLIGRYILPWFGGYAGVWSVMMVFFQAMLLLGYCYAHVLCTRLRPKTQVVVHLLVLCAALALLPIVPSPDLKPDAGVEPIFRILILLFATLGLPYFAVSTTGPLVQAWYARSFPGRSPYMLYALSNVGSLLALLSYPFVVEPLLGRHDQALTWSWGFGAFAVCCAVSAVISCRPSAPAVAASARRGSRKQTETIYASRPRPVMWVTLSALASMLLLSFTNELCVDVASVPFLWVLPLSCYLLSFIVTFSSGKAFSRKIWHPLAFLALICIASIMFHPGRLEMHVAVLITLYASSLFILCCALHGELYMLRPEPSRLTGFYLLVSVGGVLGGTIVGIVAPLFFKGYFEMYLAMIITFFTISLLVYQSYKDKCIHKKFCLNAKYIFAISNVLFSSIFIFGFYFISKDYLHMERNFYGTFIVSESNMGKENAGRAFYSGTTVHGTQYLNPEYKNRPTGYFTPYSGVGIALNAVRKQGRKVGVVGLGAGTLASYGRPGDVFTFYEINPACLDIARQYFTYLDDSRARIETKLGDGRLSLEQEEPQGFDVLVLDAFTSDSIPMHLLTLEAFEIYLRHLNPDGVICVNISNRHVNLAPVLKALSVVNRIYAYGWSAGEGQGFSGLPNDFVVMSRSLDFIKEFNVQADYVRSRYTPPGQNPDALGHGFSIKDARDVRPWSDDFSNLFVALKPLSF